jgi:hypothetical protein
VDSSDERWETREEVLAARIRYESGIPGWRCPSLYAVGTRQDDGRIRFPFICHGDHPLPAVVMATICGHEHGSAGYDLTVEQLSDAISRLAPAEACQDWDHPNLAAWREVRRAVTDDSVQRIVAVFDADPHLPSESPEVIELRRQAERLVAPPHIH